MLIIVNGVMKFIFMLYKLLNLVDINIKEDFKVIIECFDSCVVFVVSIVCEYVVVFEIVKVLFEEF